MKQKTKGGLIFGSVLVIAHLLLHWIGTKLSFEGQNNIYFVSVILFITAFLMYTVYKN